MSAPDLDPSEQAYRQSVLDWRRQKEAELRADDGWLTLAGLFVLKDGQNTVGSLPTMDVTLPPGSAPAELGVIDFANRIATLRLNTGHDVRVDGSLIQTSTLQDDTEPGGPTYVTVNAITFFLIKRGDNYAIRVRDLNNPLRQEFQGRCWFDYNPAFRAQAKYTAHSVPRSLPIMTSTDLLTPLDNIGRVDFALEGLPLHLEAFTEDEGILWFIFKDRTSGPLTYGACRFLKTPLTTDGVINLDFNRAYSPPCAFNHFATCPLPPKENILPVRIMAGERNSSDGHT